MQCRNGVLIDYRLVCEKLTVFPYAWYTVELCVKFPFLWYSQVQDRSGDWREIHMQNVSKQTQRPHSDISDNRGGHMHDLDFTVNMLGLCDAIRFIRRWATHYSQITLRTYFTCITITCGLGVSKIRRMKQICCFRWAPKAKRFSASGGFALLCSPDHGLSPWTPLGALPRPRYRLALHALNMRVHPTFFDQVTPLYTNARNSTTLFSVHLTCSGVAYAILWESSAEIAKSAFLY